MARLALGEGRHPHARARARAPVRVYLARIYFQVVRLPRDKFIKRPNLSYPILRPIRLYMPLFRPGSCPQLRQAALNSSAPESNGGYMRGHNSGQRFPGRRASRAAAGVLNLD